MDTDTNFRDIITKARKANIHRHMWAAHKMLVEVRDALVEEEVPHAQLDLEIRDLVVKLKFGLKGLITVEVMNEDTVKIRTEGWVQDNVSTVPPSHLRASICAYLGSQDFVEWLELVLTTHA